VVTGFWQAGRGTWEPSGELAAFLAGGPPPVFLAFGSAAEGELDPAELRATVYDAVRRAGVRALVQGTWVEDPPEGVLQVGEAPYVDLFGHVAAVVHQGGIGVTAAGLACGRPTIIAARGGDAFFWADRVAAIGAGPRLPRGTLDAGALAAALRAATADDGIAARAQAVGAAIRAEDGPGAAAAAIRRALA
jgi:UDP:flavonoid glycosyltransferase YjiC (YdhE family)